MLKPFLFVGLGGSGGKTLRVIRDELLRTVAAAGYDRGLPAGWQFLYIDVRAEQEDTDPALPDPLPEDQYLGLSDREQSYMDIDTLLVESGPEAYEQVAPWRPEADSADRDINIVEGAGQYRALGRAVTGAAMAKLVRALDWATTRTLRSEAREQLPAVSRMLGDRRADGAELPPPVVVVISSISGGSGAGALIDVCDALRSLGRNWGESLAVLYTPDVFNELKIADRAGVQSNAIATVSEIMSAYWATPNSVDGSGHAVDEGRFALLNRIKATGGLNRSGPRYPLLVGRGDASLQFTSQADVYRAVGRSLATWVTSRQLQDQIGAVLSGNWTTSAKGGALIDRTGLAPMQQQPFSSFGHATLSLGRADRFADYAAGRIAGTAVSLLATGLLRPRPDEPADQREARVSHTVKHRHQRFYDDCELLEGTASWAGVLRHDVTDALRGGPRETSRRDSPRERRFDDLASDVLENLTEGRQVLQTANLVTVILGRIHEAREQVLSDERQHVQTNAQAWVRDVQRRIAGRAGDLAARIGIPATQRVLDMTAQHLRDLDGPLRKEAAANRRTADETPEELRKVVRGFPDKVGVPNSAVADLVEDAVSALWHRAEADLYDLAADLVAELAGGVVLPMTAALGAAHERLTIEAKGTEQRPSRVAEWQRRAVPARFHPSENEFLLERVDSYPDALDEILRQTCETPSEETALNVAAVQAVTRKGLVRVSREWSTGYVLAAEESQEAGLTVTVGLDWILDAAKHWVRNQQPVGAYVSESLHDYLAGDDRRGEARHQERLDTFRAAFAQLAARSTPFATIDASVLSRVHVQNGAEVRRVCTEIPFGPEHPARQIVTEVLSQGAYVDPEKVDGLFDDSTKRQSIEMTAFLQPYNPVAFRSLTETISDDLERWRSASGNEEFWTWRRSRPLPEFVPLPPERRRAMVRGWFVAGALNQMWLPRRWDSGDPVRIWIPRLGWQTFPSPLLGRRVRRANQALPALLESLPLALFEFASARADTLLPYRRLADLGGVMADDEDGNLELPEVMEDWIDAEEVPDGAPDPAGALADSTADPRDELAEAADLRTWQARGTAVMRYLQERQVVYEDIFRKANEALYDRRPVPPAWELREDIGQGLSLLIAAVGQHQPRRLRDVG